MTKTINQLSHSTSGLAFLSLALMMFIFSGCSSSKVDDPTPDCTDTDLLIEDLEIIDAGCNEPGSITIIASGGSGNLSYSLGGVVFQESSVFESLSAGSYNVIVRDGNKCEVSAVAAVDVSDGGILISVDSKTESGCEGENGTLIISATGGDGNFQFRLNGGSFNANQEFSGLDQGTHTVQVKDGEDCISSKEVFVASGVSLSADIMPIIDNSCAIAGCHGDEQAPLFTGENAVRNNASAIATQTSSKAMPPSGEPDLTQNQIDLISCWAEDVTNGN